MKGDFDKAIADLAEAVRFKPNYAEAYYDRGYVYSQKNEKAKAEADFEQARKLGYKPKDSP